MSNFFYFVGPLMLIIGFAWGLTLILSRTLKKDEQKK